MDVIFNRKLDSVQNQPRNRGLIVDVTARPVRLRGISAYEKLRAEYIAANQDLDEAALLDACIKFAKMTGLTLRQKLLEIRKNG